MARKINYGAINKNAIQNLKYIDDELIKAGYGYIQRLAILGNIQRESGGNPLAVSSNGLWHGIIQWDKDRYRIQSNNVQEELQRQTRLLLKELEKKGWAGQTWKDQVAYAKSFKDSSDLRQAVDIFTRRFVRPGDINGEINKRFNFAQLGWQDEDDTEYDLETAKKVLPKSLINAWRKNPQENHLPSGYTAEDGKWHALKSVYHPSWEEELKWQQSPENLNEMLNYGYQEDYVSKYPIYKPFIKYQRGGNLVYKAFESTDDLTDIPDTFQELTYNMPSNFIVESVKPWNIDDFVTWNKNTHKEQNQTGFVEYKSDDIDVGNMQGLIDAMVADGIKFRITSGHRPGAKTSSGKISHHAHGNAIDITPIAGESWSNLMFQITHGPNTVAYMRQNGLGILNEISPAAQKRYGATGANIHIGPDGHFV